MPEPGSRSGPRAPRRLSRKTLIRRAGATLVGVVFAVFGAGLVWLLVSAAVQKDFSYVITLIVFALGAFITLFGVSTAWQSALGEPTSRGFFMRWVMAASAKTTPANVLLGVAALAVGALALGFLLERGREISAGSGLLSVWAAFHLQILFHEYGHWFAAQACGYRPFRVIGGAFGFSLQGDRWVAYRNREWCFLTGGAVFTSAPAYAQTWARDFWVVAAGPLATGLLLYASVEASTMTGRVPVLHDFIQTNITFGTIALVVNLVPLPFAFGAAAPGTDGYQLLKLLRRR